MSGKRSCIAVAAMVIAGPALWCYAGELEQRSNPVPNGSIVINGDFADWASVTPFSPDPAGDAGTGGNDWTQAWMAHDDTYLFFRFERAADSLPFTNAGYRVILDTDENLATGRSILGSLNLAVGAEFSSNSALSLDRWPPGAATCTSGLGGLAFAATSVQSPAVFEARVPRTTLLTVFNDPGSAVATEFRFVCYGYNGFVSTDVYPDGGVLGGTDYFHYSTTGATPVDGRPAGMIESMSNSVAPGAITIDGDLSDWAAIAAYPSDPTGDGARDFKSITIAHDDTYYYVRLEAAENSTYGLNDGTGWFWIMVDTNPAVAQYTGWVSTDSTDYIFQGPLIGSWGTSWDSVAFPPTQLAVEGAVLRSDIGDPAAMNLVFVGDTGSDFYPDGGFNADYFHYTVHPPTPTGGDPVEVFTLSNKVADGAISIDGNFADWAGLNFFPDDAVGDGAAAQDWVKASIAHDSANLYLMVEKAPGSAGFQQGAQGQGYWIVLDTDRDKATGFTGFGSRSFSIGGEYNWGGLGTNAWTSNGCFDHGVPHVIGMPPGDAEFAIARATFGNPTDFNVAFIGENSGDLYPDSAATSVFHYTTGAPLDPLPADIAVSLSNPVPDGAITVDGSVADWQVVAPYPEDATGDGAGSQDWVQVWIAHDSKNFYVRMKRAPGSIGWPTPGYWGAFDTDRNPATGIQLGGTKTGAEFNTGGIVGFNRWSSSGGYLGGAPFVATADGGGLSDKIEAAIALSELGNPTRFRVIYVGEHSGDYYPEGANADKTFLYAFRPCQKPFADADGDGDVDQEDFGVWQACFSGEGTPAGDACACFDRDYGEQGDGDIDTTDLTAFVKCLSGPMVPAAAECEK